MQLDDESRTISALFCQLDKVCMTMSSCFAVAEILPLLSAIFLTSSALKAAL